MNFMPHDSWYNVPALSSCLSSMFPGFLVLSRPQLRIGVEGEIEYVLIDFWSHTHFAQSLDVDPLDRDKTHKHLMVHFLV
jgi:hypothetical protein